MYGNTCTCSLISRKHELLEMQAIVQLHDLPELPPQRIFSRIWGNLICRCTVRGIEVSKACICMFPWYYIIRIATHAMSIKVLRLSHFSYKDLHYTKSPTTINCCCTSVHRNECKATNSDGSSLPSCFGCWFSYTKWQAWPDRHGCT